MRRWDEEPAVVDSDPSDDWGWETELLRSPPWREHLIADVGGRAIGFVQIIDPALEDSHTGATCRRICVPWISGSARRTRAVAGMAAR